MEVTPTTVQTEQSNSTRNFVGSVSRLIQEGRLVPGKHRSRDWMEELDREAFWQLNSLLSECDGGSEEAMSKLISLATVLCYLEEGPEAVQISEKRLPDLLHRVTMLTSLEELRRNGLIEYDFPRLLDDDAEDQIGITMLDDAEKP